MTSKANIIDSIQKYADVLGNNKAFGTRMVYRGQTSDKPLLPKLFRIERIPEAARSLSNLEHELLQDFKNQAKPFLQTIPDDDDVLQWLALAQHHGLPTRLLDWTQNPLVALFFAVEDMGQNGDDGVVWQMNMVRPQNSRVSNLSELDNLFYEGLLYFPSHINNRITAQQSCFTAHRMPKIGEQFVPLDCDISLSNFQRSMRKLVIPHKAKLHLRYELDKLGISYFTIFPDLGGLCKKLEWKIYYHEGQPIHNSEIAEPNDVMYVLDEAWEPGSGMEVGEAELNLRSIDSK